MLRRTHPALVLLLACSDGAVQPDQIDTPPCTGAACVRDVSCSAAGTLHSGDSDAAVWRASDSPHYLRDSVSVRTLTVEAGAKVCGFPGAVLVVGSIVSPSDGRFSAVGSPSAKIIFTAVDPTRPWRGIRLGTWWNRYSDAVLAHVLIEYAEEGVAGGEWATMVIEDSHFRRAGIGSGTRHGGKLDLRRTIVDSGSVVMWRGVFEDNVIRGGGLWVCDVTIDGGRIENSPGVAFSAGNPIFPTVACNSATVHSTRPLRIVGSQGHPVHSSIRVFQTLWPTSAVQDSLLGNANDTIMLWREAAGTPLHVRSEFTWVFQCGWESQPTTVPCQLTNVTIDAATSLIVQGELHVHDRLTANGTPARIRIYGAHEGGQSTPDSSAAGGQFPPKLILSESGSSQLSHVSLAGLWLVARQDHQVQLSQIRSNGPVKLNSTGSSILDSEIDGFHQQPILTGNDDQPAALQLSAPGVRAERVVIRRTTGAAALFPGGSTPATAVLIDAFNAQLLQCQVVDNEDDGVRVLSGANIRINDCNIERNGQAGVNNVGSSKVDARRNWWGDAGGPFGPNGDGVRGDVDFSEFVTSPFIFRTSAALFVRERLNRLH